MKKILPPKPKKTNKVKNNPSKTINKSQNIILPPLKNHLRNNLKRKKNKIKQKNKKPLTNPIRKRMSKTNSLVNLMKKELNLQKISIIMTKSLSLYKHYLIILP
jgi:hypothetical protein